MSASETPLPLVSPVSVQVGRMDAPPEVPADLSSALADIEADRLHWWSSPVTVDESRPSSGVRPGWPVCGTRSCVAAMDQYQMPHEAKVAVLLVAAGLNVGRSHPSIVSHYDMVSECGRRVRTVEIAGWVAFLTVLGREIALLTVHPAAR